MNVEPTSVVDAAIRIVVVVIVVVVFLGIIGIIVLVAEADEFLVRLIVAVAVANHAVVSALELRHRLLHSL